VTLDRASVERKDPETIARLLTDPTSRAVFAGSDGVLVRDGALMRTGLVDALLRSRRAGALMRTERADALMPTEAVGAPEPILLGLEDDDALFAVDLDTVATSALPDGGRVVALRDAGTQLPQAEGGLAAYATALLNWHRRHRFCANCGAATEVAEAGLARHCSRCGAMHFPRTDPVVIMTVTHEDRLLLGRRVGWPPGRCSVLAGFISPGESAEEAVVREVQEESGIVSRDPAYVTSQPWPFPASLMLGFDAASDGGEPQARDGELEEVRWYSLDEVRAAAEERNPDLQLPPPVSVARYLIDRWLRLRSG
jgi:NAD+ diphosphatase